MQQSIKPVNTSFPISENIKNRWSPRAFDSRPIEEEKLMCILEAGRWAASAFNEQPWRFVVGKKGDGKYEKILASLVEWNQQWAGKAPVLILNLAKKTFTRNGNPNATAVYDLGQAVAYMAAEAVHQGLVSHQMSGFDAEKARTSLAIAEDFKAVSVMALGYYGDSTMLPEDMQQSESAARTRKPLKELLF
jgi:nitroreductase